MDDFEHNNGIDPWELSLEAILAEYESETEAPESSLPPTEARSREIVMEALGDELAASLDSRADFPQESDYAEELPQEEIPEEDVPDEDIPEEEIPPEEPPEPEPPKRKFVWVRDPLDGSHPQPELPEDEVPQGELPEDETPETAETEFTGDAGDYAAADYPPYDDPEAEAELRAGIAPAKRPSPLVALLAAFLIRRRQRAEAKAAAVKAAQPQEEPPEPAPKKAARFYARSATPYKLRGVAAAALCVVLLYISCGWGTLPMAGALNQLRVCALVCLILELSVMMLGLDVFAAGLGALFRGRPNLETLVAVSCIFSAVDAAIIALGGPEHGLPFSAVSALSMTCALWGSRMLCNGLRRSFRAAALSAEPSVVTAQEGALDQGTVLIKSRRDIRGFVNRAQDADVTESAYSVAAPILLVAAPVLAFVATVCMKRAGDFFHVLSALTAVIASFSAFLSFPLPFAVIARRLASSGAAIAGWSGCADIGESRRTVVTDEDLFPPGNVIIDTVRILEGVYTDKVISYAGSVIAASGCGLTPAFTDLMQRNGCAMQQVENFSCHKGGGLTAIVRGEQVFVGDSSFMNLMGIRLPQSQLSKSSAFVAISGVLVGVFAVRYTPTAAVQEALVTLLHSRGGDPLFAVRDFNVTPLLIKQRFRMPTEGFDFPSFPERYRVSAIAAAEDAAPAALLARDGLGPYVETVSAGRGVYKASRLCLALSLLGSVLGLVLMFLLCAVNAFDSAHVGNLLTFMILWLVPVAIVTLGLRR